MDKNIPPDYLETNKASWNNKVNFHISSEFYNVEAWKNGKSSLHDIELNLLGAVSGKSILHLQCHFGQDTISLARMGAKTTGIDLSDKAIEVARNLAKDMNVDASFICCDLYDLPQHLDSKFDIVYTSYGTIGWLPDMDKWAEVIQYFLKPGGQFIFVEFHPVVWMFDDDFKGVAYDYFNKGAIIETYTGTYADKEAPIVQEYVMWNHSISEVVQSLLGKGLSIKSLMEYDYSPYNCFRHTEQTDINKYIIKHFGNKIPMVYSVVAEKN